MVIEALVVNVDENGTEVLDARRGVGPGGLVHPDVRRAAGREPDGHRAPARRAADQMEIDGNGLDRPLVEMLGMSVDESAEGRVSLPVHPYLHNSIEAVQGGAMALLGDVAAAEALGAAAGLPGAAMVVTDLQVAYLTLGRIGPIVTRTTVLDAAGAAVPPRRPAARWSNWSTSGRETG